MQDPTTLDHTLPPTDSPGADADAHPRAWARPVISRIAFTRTLGGGSSFPESGSTGGRFD